MLRTLLLLAYTLSFGVCVLIPPIFRPSVYEFELEWKLMPTCVILFKNLNVQIKKWYFELSLWLILRNLLTFGHWRAAESSSYTVPLSMVLNNSNIHHHDGQVPLFCLFITLRTIFIHFSVSVYKRQTQKCHSLLGLKLVEQINLMALVLHHKNVTW